MGPTATSCPFSNGSSGGSGSLGGLSAAIAASPAMAPISEPDFGGCPAQSGYNAAANGGMTYGEYLKLGRLLNCQDLKSKEHDVNAPDEHLFIIVHQVYELWFKQIIFDLDIVRSLFLERSVDEKQTLKIVSRLERIVKILKVLVDQVLILETMSPLDFLEFRKYITPASGFQSLQFRLLENKLGVPTESRVQYNKQHYANVFRESSECEALERSEEEPSLLELVEKWLERVPGLEENSFNFWKKYERAVRIFLDNERANIDNHKQFECKAEMYKEYEKTRRSFETVLDPVAHQELVKIGQRRLSHQATKGALMIMFYRDLPRFSQPYQMLSALVDIDSLMTKWRYNHVMLVQRMIGSKTGTGGSSGYQYLRATCSDRYQVFLDLSNMATFLVPRAFVPPLSPEMERRLSCAAHPHHELFESSVTQQFLLKRRLEAASRSCSTDSELSNDVPMCA